MYLRSDAVMDQRERVIREMGVDVEEKFGFWQGIMNCSSKLRYKASGKLRLKAYS
jgi:hypothetical protein